MAKLNWARARKRELGQRTEYHGVVTIDIVCPSCGYSEELGPVASPTPPMGRRFCPFCKKRALAIRRGRESLKPA
jgi:hypothetical protein